MLNVFFFISLLYNELSLYKQILTILQVSSRIMKVVS